MTPIPADRAHDVALAELRAGRPVVVPTDTVYGVAVLAADADAVAQLFRLKGRPEAVAIAVLVADTDQAAEYATLGEVDRALADEFWPGPLTLVCAGRRRLAVGASDGTVGLRCPDADFVRDLAAAAGPLATTSANRHGEPPANTAPAAAEALGDASLLVVDGGEGRGVASTVVRTDPDLVVLRDGPVGRDELVRVARGAGRSDP